MKLVKRVSCCLLVVLLLGVQLYVAAAEVPSSIDELPVLEKDTVAEETSDSYAAYIEAMQSVSNAASRITVDAEATVGSEFLRFNVEVPFEGLYMLGLSYRGLDDKTTELKVALQVDGNYPFEEASSLLLDKIWKDFGDIRKDGAGNELARAQAVYEQCVTVYPRRPETTKPYLLFLTAGTHTISISCRHGEIYLSKLILDVPETVEAYTAPVDGAVYYSGDPIVREGEEPLWKNSYWLVSLSDNTSAKVTPNDAVTRRINHIGGSNWKQVGETITWSITAPQDGYYQLGFSYRQSTLVNYSSYRRLMIDGETPFAEVSAIEFPYGVQWNKKALSDASSAPYLFYLSAGEHELSLQVTLGPYEEICQRLEEVITELGDLYLEMTMITGETVDTARDYDLFNAIPNLESRLVWCSEQMELLEQKLIRISGGKGGTYDSSLRSMNHTVKKMLDNKFSASKHKNNYYSSFSSLSECAHEMKSMPLDIDQIILSAVEDEETFAQETGVWGFFKQTWFSARRFFASFTSDYNNISVVADDANALTLWVNWGQDQARVLNSMIQSDFTPNSGISVRVRVVNTSIVQAIVSGNGPDCIFHRSRTEPVNLAMRGALYDLSQFEDYKDVLTRFQDGAEIPYYYNEGLYALPDTQTFDVLFYRKDILEKFGLEVPRTWEEFENAAEVLIHNNLLTYIPYTQITDTAVVNSGVGALSLYPTLLLQNKVAMYSEDGKSTNLTDTKAMKIFEKWTDYYTKMKFPISVNFYNRFRSGTCPLGISSYTVAVTLKAEAPELDSKWAMAALPGVVQEDGSVDSTAAGGGTGCAILEMSENKAGAWEFLKWWTEGDTQATYSTNLESILGPTGRVMVSSIEAQKALSWTDEEITTIMNAWGNVKELPEYPGGYQVSRSIDMAFYNVTNDNQRPKDALTKWGEEADREILRKWTQYEN